MGAPSGLSRTSRKLWHLCKVLYVLEHKTQYLWSMCHLPALWYFDISVIRPHRFCWVKFVLIPPCFVLQQYLWNICEISSVSCYNVWANSCCSGCSPLWEKSLRNGTITWANDDLCLCRHMISLGFSELTLTFTCFSHSYSDTIMSTMASQITSLTIFYSIVYSGADQRKFQSSALLAFVQGIRRWLLNSPHKGPVSNAENVSIWWRHHG